MGRRPLLKIAKSTLALLIASFMTVLLYLNCYVPYVCNQLERRLEAAARTAVEMQDTAPLRAAVQARWSLARLDQCLRCSPERVNLYMIAAANHRVLRRYDDAIQAYRAALQYDRRPEIYFNLGLVLLEVGDIRQAVPVLVTAGRFGHLVNLIPHPEVRNEVIRILARQETWRAPELITNSPGEEK